MSTGILCTAASAVIKIGLRNSKNVQDDRAKWRTLKVAFCEKAFKIRPIAHNHSCYEDACPAGFILVKFASSEEAFRRVPKNGSIPRQFSDQPQSDAFTAFRTENQSNFQVVLSQRVTTFSGITRHVRVPEVLVSCCHHFKPESSP